MSAAGAITHGTTVVAIRYADGVVMAGDRRATSGNLICHRAIEKVFPADRYSGVAIAGAAGPAMEMVKLFQLQLEHYEKVEGSALSLEGKANQLSQMVRNHLPAAMQGLAVVPLFAGYDTRREAGPPLPVRRHRRPLRGERLRHLRLGRPPRRHRREARLPRGPRPRATPSTWPSRRCSTPPTRTPPPAAPTWSGASSRWSPPSTPTGFTRVADAELAERFDAWSGPASSAGAIEPHHAPAPPLETTDEHALLRRPRAGHEGPGRLRPQGHRPGPQPGGRRVRRRHRDLAENPSSTLRKVTEIYDRIAFAGVGKYNEFDQLRIAGVRAADLKGYSFSREDVDARSLANQYAQILGQVFTHEMKPLEVEILVAEVGADPSQDQLFHLLYDGTVIDETGIAVLGGDAEAVAERLARRPAATTPTWPRALRVAVGALAGPDRTLAAGRPRGGAARPRRRPPVLPPPRRRRGGRPARRRRQRHRLTSTPSAAPDQGRGHASGQQSTSGERSCASSCIALVALASVAVACGASAATIDRHTDHRGRRRPPPRPRPRPPPPTTEVDAVDVDEWAERLLRRLRDLARRDPGRQRRASGQGRPRPTSTGAKTAIVRAVRQRVGVDPDAHRQHRGRRRARHRRRRRRSSTT